MPFQLIFTSAPQGLNAGRSGYCTVARHRAMSERLAQLLEALGTPHEAPVGATFTFREIEASGQTWFVLSRFVAAGLDYTQRDNRLAHHLVFTAEETALLPPPASLALRWQGWHQEWTGAPTWLEDEAKPLVLGNHPPLAPALTWREYTGTGAKAAWLVTQQSPTVVGLLNPPELSTLLRLLAESSALLGKSAWIASFTTDTAATGAEGFAWAVGATSGRPTIDLAEAKSLPAPSGDLARQAATGTTQSNRASSQAARPSSASQPSSNKSGGSSLKYFALALSLIAIASVFAWLALRTPELSPAPPAPIVVAPPVIDSAKADEILRNNRALRDVQSFLESDDFVAAGKLWLELSERSPAFAQTYREQVLPRLLGRFALSTLAQLNEKLDRPAITINRRLAQEVLEEAIEVQRVGTQLLVADDEDWKKILTIPDRARQLQLIDVRPVILLRGEWLTSAAGPQTPSSADFSLSAAGADRIRALMDAAGATLRDSATVRLRLLPATSFHLRDETTPFLVAEIRRNARTSWLESAAEPGRQPAITINLGERRSSITLNFPAGQNSEAPNRVLELTFANGQRHCLALLGDPTKLTPLNLGPFALRQDDTGVVRAAAWAETALNAFTWVGGSVGLYPDGHEFPDRDLPSIRATRSLLETDLIRLENKQGPGTLPYDIIAARRKAFQAGDSLRAGAPWSLYAVDARGNAGPLLIEFR